MNTVINIRINKSIRDQAKKVFSKMGLSTSAGIALFLYQVASEKGLPFIPTTDPKKIRARWDAQVTDSLKAKRYLNAKSALRGL
jgi:addiction module RelB/DinJ family antitoxin